MTEYKQTLTIVSASPIEVTTKPDDRSWRDPLEGHRSTQTLLVYDRVASTRQKLDLIDERLYPVEYHDLDTDGVTVFEDMKSLTSWLSDVMFPEDKSDPFHPYPWTWINGAQSLQRSVDSWKVASPPGQPIPDHLTIELVTALSKYSPVLEFTQIVDDLEGTPIELPYWRGGLPLRPKIEWDGVVYANDPMNRETRIDQRMYELWGEYGWVPEQFRSQNTTPPAWTYGLNYEYDGGKTPVFARYVYGMHKDKTPKEIQVKRVK